MREPRTRAPLTALVAAAFLGCAASATVVASAPSSSVPAPSPLAPPPDTTPPVSTFVPGKPAFPGAHFGQKFTMTDRDLARSAPAVPLGAFWKAPTTTITTGPCWTRLEWPAPPLPMPGAGALLTAREGPTWHARGVSPESDVDPHTGALWMAMRYRDGKDVGPATAELPDALLRRVRATVWRNADLLGLTAADFDGLVWEIHQSLERTLIAWDGEVEARAVPDAPFPQLARKVWLHYSLDADGKLSAFNIRSRPAVTMCTTPRITAAQAEHADGVPANAGTAKLSIDAKDDPRGRTYRLVYDVASSCRSYLVDAETGASLGSRTTCVN